MVANMIGPAGSPPPSQREAELQAEIERLRAELQAARELVERAERFIAIHPSRQAARDEAESYLVNSLWAYKHIARGAD